MCLIRSMVFSNLEKFVLPIKHITIFYNPNIYFLRVLWGMGSFSERKTPKRVPASPRPRVPASLRCHKRSGCCSERFLYFDVCGFFKGAEQTDFVCRKRQRFSACCRFLKLSVDILSVGIVLRCHQIEAQ